ncbi:MAG: glycosyltransferase family 4 protein [Verrucomicrobiota bacterium]
MSTDKKLKIFVFTSTYARHEDDPQVPWMRQTNNRLKKLGHHVEVIAPTYKGLKSHTINGIKVNRFRYAPKSWENLTHDSGAPDRVKSPLFKLLTIPYLAAGFIYTTLKLIKERPDIIKVHWPFPHGMVAWFGARLTGTKIVSVCHGAELAIVRGNSFLQRVLSWHLRHSDLVYCNSSHTLSQIRSLPKSNFRVEIVTYGSSVGSKGSDQINQDSDSPLILSCGRVIERKGYPYLIKAMPAILEKHPKAKLVITSDGDRRAECEDLIKQLGLSDSIRMAGYISAEELSSLYQNAAIYAHPSIIDSKGDTEGLGVVLVEALSYKKPVVACGVGGIVDVIKHDVSGRLVPEKDPQALANEIIRLLDDPELATKLGERGFEYAQKHFTWDRIINRFSGLLIAASQSKGASAHHSQPAQNAAGTIATKDKVLEKA